MCVLRGVGGGPPCFLLSGTRALSLLPSPGIGHFSKEPSSFSGGSPLKLFVCSSLLEHVITSRLFQPRAKKRIPSSRTEISQFIHCTTTTPPVPILFLCLPPSTFINTSCTVRHHSHCPQHIACWLATPMTLPPLFVDALLPCVLSFSHLPGPHARKGRSMCSSETKSRFFL